MTIDHRPIPFSSFAGIDKPRQRRMLAANPWRCMELTLRSKKTTTEECLAYLRQAHDFLIAQKSRFDGTTRFCEIRIWDIGHMHI